MGGAAMERHFSTGVATIAALMAAHRVIDEHADDDGALACAFREEAARIDDGLTRRPGEPDWFPVST